MINSSEILQTIRMFDQQHLDIRTITMGISLLDCADPDPKAACRKVYDKICRRAQNLVATGQTIEKEFGIPIVNKRVSVTPVSLISAAFPEKAPLIGKALDEAAATLGIDFLGGYSALVHKSTAAYERTFIKTIPEVLASTQRLCSSVNVGSTRSGINMEAVKLMGETFKAAAKLTAEKDGIGAAKLVAFCNAVEDNPFMAGSTARAKRTWSSTSACPAPASSSTPSNRSPTPTLRKRRK